MNTSFIKSTLGLIPLVAASTLGLVGEASAADVKGIQVFVDNDPRPGNGFGFTGGGYTLRYVDPSGGCNLLTLAGCDGDEYLSIDFNPADAPPTDVPNPIAGDDFGAVIREGTEAVFPYGESNTARGIADEFFSPSSLTPVAAIGLDVIVGAYASSGASPASVPRTLFIDMDVQGLGANSIAPGDYADLLYVDEVSDVSIAEVGGQTNFTLDFFGPYARGTRNGDGFGNVSNVDFGPFGPEPFTIDGETGLVSFTYDWEGIFTFQISQSLDEVLAILASGEAIESTLSADISFSPEFVIPTNIPEPSSILGLLSVLGVGTLLKKKKQG